MRLTVALLVLLGFAADAGGDQKPATLIIATWNLEWFYDDYPADNYSKLAKGQSAPSREEWEWKLGGVADAIAKIGPTIIALQEIESEQVAYYLARRLKEDHQLFYRIAFVKGDDRTTEQDCAILAKSGLVECGRWHQSRETGKDEELYQLDKHLFARFAWGEGDGQVKLNLLNLHLKATPENVEFRKRQGRLVQEILGPRLKRGEQWIVLGDLGTEVKFADTKADSDIGLLRGLSTEDPADDLFDLHGRLNADERDTHLTGRQFDRILLSPSLTPGEGRTPPLVLKSVTRRKDVVVRGGKQDADHYNVFWKIPQEERDLSDHYPLVAEFEFAE